MLATETEKYAQRIFHCFHLHPLLEMRYYLFFSVQVQDFESSGIQ